MGFGIDLADNVRDDAFFVDQEGSPYGAHVLLAIHGFFLPEIVQLHDLLVGISQQGKIKTVLINKLPVGLLVVYADADDLVAGSLKGREIFIEVTGLRRTTRSIVFGVEIQHHLLAPVAG